jgi:hypothetical protein
MHYQIHIIRINPEAISPFAILKPLFMAWACLGLFGATEIDAETVWLNSHS